RDEVARPLGARERQGTGWQEWVSAELCVADDPLFVRKVVARLKAAVDWQRQRALQHHRAPGSDGSGA
ncbi:hypothetical protein ACV34S_35080, partial [Pseudomonas aeruginosa]